CALQVLLISSVLFAGVSSSVTVQELAASEEADSPFEEQEEQEEEVAKFSEQQARYSKGNLSRWRDGDRSSFTYGRGTRRAIEGHCLANGLRAPLLH
ncbi:MAG: hypothetical protein VB862_01490, partial [Pirellulaceae bacterium]